ncbi:MAG: helix-hairpin-helix domain-containing protein [Candidatus Hydrogenedentes bacterium]|nr:helix-hairpin-helix domain-containing protein [Candidatus Hydrogenedentota bacterium]
MVNRFLTTREQFVLAGLALAIVLGSLTAYYLRATPPGPDLAQAAEVESGLPAPIEELEHPPPDLPPPATVSEPASLPPPPPLPDLVIAVEGAVYAPGVYRLKNGERVEDALASAGGAAEDADLSDINLAAPLIDATTLHIPRKPFAGRDGEVLVLRRGPQAAAMNPPQYTRSGWRSVQGSTATPGETFGASQAAAAPAAESSGDGRINLNTASQGELETLPGIGPVTARKIIAHREAHPFTSVESLTDVSGIGPKTLEAVRSLVTVQ